MKLVSVIMPVHNAAPYLNLAITSIQRQTYQNFEFIIVDDGSTDNSVTVARHLAKSDPRIKLFQRSKKGVADALNFAISRANGKYLARMDADDISLPYRLKTQIEFLELHEQVGILGTQIQKFGKARLGKTSSFPCNHIDILRELDKGRFPLCHPTFLMRRDLVKDSGGYWSLPFSEDLDLVLRLARQCKIVNRPETLLYYRIHNQSINLAQFHLNRDLTDFARHIHGEQRDKESTFQEFAKRRRPLIKKLDRHGLHMYLRGSSQVLNGEILIGLFNLLGSAGLAPRRTARFLLQNVQRRWECQHKFSSHALVGLSHQDATDR